MREKRDIYLDDPVLGEREKEYLLRCLESTYVSTCGPFVPAFEEKFALFLGVKKAVSLQSGTAGLHMALWELGIGPGDEVIIPALTFVATANAVKYVGARPIFADVHPSTWTLDPEDFARLITERTRAVIPVHLYGNACAMEEICAIAKRRGIYVIEDATESLGTLYRGRYTGTWGDFGIFSFNGNKLITTGGGGMIVGNDENRLNHIKYLINQARVGADDYYHGEIGFNLRMTNLEASLGLAQMERIKELMEKKKRFRRIYEEAFGDVKWLKMPEPQGESEVLWWLNPIKINTHLLNVSLLAFQERLKELGIPTRRLFRPLNTLPPYAKDNTRNYRVAEEIFSHGLCLPSSPLNDEENIKYVARTITASFSEKVALGCA